MISENAIKEARELPITDMLLRYGNAIAEIGGYNGLIKLPAHIQEALRETEDLVIKTLIMEAYIGGMK